MFAPVSITSTRHVLHISCKQCTLKSGIKCASPKYQTSGPVEFFPMGRLYFLPAIVIRNSLYHNFENNKTCSGPCACLYLIYITYKLACGGIRARNPEVRSPQILIDRWPESYITRGNPTQVNLWLMRPDEPAEGGRTRGCGGKKLLLSLERSVGPGRSWCRYCIVYSVFDSPSRWHLHKMNNCSLLYCAHQT